jgi:transcriptional regulator with XRE-family HTH domain
MGTTTETEAFAQRLRQALEACAVRASPTVVANEFNLRYWGRSITTHTARNWLLGNSIPTQDKLRVLAEWLQVSPDELRFGRPAVVAIAKEADAQIESLNLADREMLSRYLALSLAERKTVRDVVEALFLAATIKKTK